MDLSLCVEPGVPALCTLNKSLHYCTENTQKLTIMHVLYVSKERGRGQDNNFEYPVYVAPRLITIIDFSRDTNGGEAI